LFLALSCSKNEGIKPTLGTVTESVYASGIIKTNDQYTVYSTVNGILQNKSAGTSIGRARSVAFELESEKQN
jgi:hypothetical protein